MMLTVGQSAPDFTLFADDGNPLTLSSLQGKNVVLFFYPKDSTPGCTQEACTFSEWTTEFLKKETVIYGISKGGVKSKQRFKEKYHFIIPLLADEDGKVCDLYGVISDKMLYGKIFKGIVRSTFLIDKKGIIREIWPSVKVDGHIEAVFEKIKNL